MRKAREKSTQKRMKKRFASARPASFSEKTGCRPKRFALETTARKSLFGFLLDLLCLIRFALSYTVKSIVASAVTTVSPLRTPVTVISTV